MQWNTAGPAMDIDKADTPFFQSYEHHMLGGDDRRGAMELMDWPGPGRCLDRTAAHVWLAALCSPDTAMAPETTPVAAGICANLGCCSGCY